MTLSIETNNLSLRYGNTAAIQDLTLRLEGGKVYGLLGRNGSGKTSLLSVLAGFRKATAGEARIGGRPIFEDQETMRQVCLVRESGDVDQDSSVRDALDLVAHLRPNWNAALAHRLVERLELSQKTAVKKLSRGKQSALGITLGLASRAPVTMFDESHLGMDAPSRYIFYEELLADFMEYPRTVIISTHLIEEVSTLLEEVVIIERGRLVLQDETEALRARGAAITGPADEVDRFVNGHTVLGERRLGRTKSAMIYGHLDPESRRQAHAAGLEIEPVALQDLFVHLTAMEEDAWNVHA